MGNLEQRPRPAAERIGDRDRDAALAMLRDHCAAGTLNLDEFSERAAAALACRTRGELDLVVADLPAVPAAADARVDAGVRRVVALFGSNRRRARWEVAGRVTAVSILGAPGSTCARRGCARAGSRCGPSPCSAR